MTATPLEHRLKALIRLGGPISIADYMAICLGDPQHGYYMARDPFGAKGDFVTAPEVSQMFGELIGLWAVDLWLKAGAPKPFQLVELGPGRGTLMIDAMRAARVKPEFVANARVHMVESSPRLTTIQWDRLAEAGIWRERVVGLDGEDQLAFGAGAAVLAMEDVPPDLRAADDGAILELAPTAYAIAEALAARIARNGLGLIAIDYGYTQTALGDSFQAVRRHAFVDPLARPGEADLTALVNFEALARAAARGGAVGHGPVEQGDFLLRLGLAERAGRLGADKDRATRDGIAADVQRLVGSEEMGSLFKVLAITAPGLQPAGF